VSKEYTTTGKKVPFFFPNTEDLLNTRVKSTAARRVSVNIYRRPACISEDDEERRVCREPLLENSYDVYKNSAVTIDCKLPTFKSTLTQKIAETNELVRAVKTYAKVRQILEIRMKRILNFVFFLAK
jgi:hypothetical protein